MQYPKGRNAVSEDLLIFTTCKPVKGEFAVLQRNAIFSWRASGFDVLIIGDEPGSKEVAAELGCFFVANVERNEKGIPYVSGLFNIASGYSDHKHIAYVNADILIQPETARNLKNVPGLSQELGDYLFVTRRRSIPLFEDITNTPQTGADHIRDLDDRFGVWDPPFAIDLFLINKGWLGEIPNMTVGRAGWDNWMLQNARRHGVAVIDGSLDCPVHHPSHGYALEAGGLEAVTTGPQAAQNRAFLDAADGRIDTSATHRLKDGKLLSGAASKTDSFGNNLGRRVLSDLMMVSHYQDEKSERTVQDLRTLLWRADCWVPPIMSADLYPAALGRVIQQGLKAAKENKANYALDMIQTVLAQPYKAWLNRELQNSRPLYVWGLGGAAKRFCNYAHRHRIRVDGFVDGTAQQESSTPDFMDGRLRPVLTHKKAAELFSGNTQPVFHIASIHRQAIIEQLQSFGAELGVDFQ